MSHKEKILSIGGIFIKLQPIFFILFSVIVVSCSPEPEADESQDANYTFIEDPDEVRDILKKAQASEEEFNSIYTRSTASQKMTGNEFNLETRLDVSNALKIDLLEGHVNVEAEMLGENITFEMYISEDATYLSDNPRDEDQLWEKFTGEDHEEITGSLNEALSFINYDILLDHADELTLTLFEIDHYEEDEYNIEVYEIDWKGDNNLYHQLLTQEDWVDGDDQPASVEEFSFTLQLEKETFYPLTIYTYMKGTQNFEGEVIDMEETVSTSISGINIFNDGDLRAPGRIVESAENNDDE